MRSVNSILVAGMATMTIMSSAALAADLPMMPPPPMPVVEDFGGWYLRGDIGMSNQKVKSLFNVLYNAPGTTVQNVNPAFDSAMTFGLGVGYQFNNWLRADITGEYRAGASFNGLDIVNVVGFPPGTDEYRAIKSEWLFLANAYADLGTWWCITPFVGAGIGMTRTTISSFMDIGTTAPGGAVAYADDASKWSMAWALYAGLGYQVTKNVTVEFAYRYLDLGDARSGDIRPFNGPGAVNNPMEFRGLTSHDFKLGIRVQCCDFDPPPAPPLVRKG